MTIDETPWRTRPRFDIDSIVQHKRLKDPRRPFEFAELDVNGTVVRYCTSSAGSRWRVQTLFTKEPGTIDWIDAFEPNDVFLDVGANVGMYSIYAGVVARAVVYAIEPESQNYAELNRSIFLNSAHQTILAYCMALTDKSVEVSRLILNDMATGLSFHDFGEPSANAADGKRLMQGSVAFSLDHLVATGAFPAPDHIKIDVDGHENRVIDGMRGQLEHGEVRTVLLECDPALPHTREIVQWMLGGGWQVNPDQLRLSREGLRPADPVLAELRAGTYVGNVIFGRKADDLAYATRALERFSPAELESMRLAE